MKRAFIALLLAVTVVAGMATPAAAQPGLNFDDSKAPNPTIHEDVLTVDTHDRGEMDSPVQYYDDNGDLAELPATVNQSQDTPVGVRFDQIDAGAYEQFPRTSSENGNDATWTIADNWTTTSDASSSMTVSQADTNGIERVNFDATAAAGETATANLTDDIDITSDANKRVMMAVVSVDELTAGSTVEIRAVDADGDYRSANITSGVNASAQTTIANSTGDGYVFQSKLNEMELEGTGDGSFDSIQHVHVVVSESDAEVTVSGLDLDGKTERDLGEVMRPDDEGEMEPTTITNWYEGGYANLTSLDTLGGIYNGAEINDLRVYNVSYQFSDLTDQDEFMTEFGESDYSYPMQLELYGDFEVPSAIDLSHGNLTFEYNQSFVSERYAVTEVATDVDSSTAFGNLSNSDYTSWSSEIGQPGDTATIAANPTTGDTHRVHMVILLQDGEAGDLEGPVGGIGPTGASGGGIFDSIWGWIGTGVASVAGFLGLRRMGS